MDNWRPSTLKKPTPNLASRMSVTGTALRTPYQTSNTLPRQSMLPMMRSQSGNPLLQSTSKPSYGRTPLNNVRRGSVWGGGPTLPSLNSSHPVKDIRPLRDKQYQTRMRQDILTYLQSSGYEISKATLSNIQGKDYRSIFEFLLVSVDPNYAINQTTRFEDVFVPALKALKYPFAHQIDNKWLAAPSSMYSWPVLLGVLHWLVESCKMFDEYLCSGHPTLQNVENIPPEFDDPHDHKALAFNYFEEAYTVWLNLIDEFVEPNQHLEDRYAKRDEAIQKDLEGKTNQIRQVQTDLENLKSSVAPISKLQNENSLFRRDSEKFQKILQQYEGRKKRLIEAIAHENAEIAQRRAHLEQLQAEQDKLAEVVKTQNLTPEEVIRMNTDHEVLSRSLEDLRQKIAETHKSVMTLEVNVTNRAAAAEEALDLYSNLIATLELVPPLPAPWENVNMTLELNAAASNAHHLLAGPDVRKVVKPVLSGIADLKRSERASLESERIKVDNEVEKVTDECENLDEEVSQGEKKVAALNEQADDLRDVAQQEALVANAEATRLERDLAHARTAALANGMGVKSQLQALQFSHREQIEKVNRLKDETVRAILKVSHHIAVFKDDVSAQLRELREFAEAD